MKFMCEVSKPHYHPGKDFKMPVTKKRDLSIPPNWVANERIEKDGTSFAIVMPPREVEKYEVTQEVHIHLPAYVIVEINGQLVRAKVKVEPHEFFPKVHFDEPSAAKYGIKPGDEGEL